jgi:hypothetical protein
MIGFYTGICLFFWRKATLKLSKAADVDENAQSSAIAIVTFFFQTVTLLDIDSGFSLGNSLGFLNLELDNPTPSDIDTEGSCLTTGRFYMDWAVKFTIPFVMAVAGFLICTVSSILRSKSNSTLTPSQVLACCAFSSIATRVADSVSSCAKNVFSFYGLFAEVANARADSTIWAVPGKSQCPPDALLPLR